MTTVLIASANRIVNLDHVTDAKFSPARDYTYEDDECQDEHGNAITVPAHDDAWLNLTMTSVEEKIISGYDGEFHGVVSVSREIRVYGAEAEALWDFMRNTSKWYMMGVKHELAD